MPIPKVDQHSGAIIFHPTPEEVKVKDIEKENSELKSTVQSLEERLQAIEKLISKS